MHGAMHGAWLVRRRRWVVKQQERVQETVDGSMGSSCRGLYEPLRAGAGWAAVGGGPEDDSRPKSPCSPALSPGQSPSLADSRPCHKR